MPTLRLMVAALAFLAVIFWPQWAFSRWRRIQNARRWLSRQPLRSTKRDSKRYVRRMASEVYGHPVSWKKARSWANAQARVEAGIQASKQRGAA